MSAEQFKHLSEAIKNVVFTVAVIVGGIWTLYTFRSLGQEQQARSTIAKLEADTANVAAQRRESELKARDFPLAIELTATPKKIGRQRQIAVVAKLHNPGAGPLLLTFREPTFRLARMVRTSDGRTVTLVREGKAMYLTSRGANDVPGRRLLGQQTRRLPYLFDVAEAGDYLVQVNVDYRDEEESTENTFAFEQELVHVD
jgi:hypothetical protein